MALEVRAGERGHCLKLEGSSVGHGGSSANAGSTDLVLFYYGPFEENMICQLYLQKQFYMSSSLIGITSGR